MISRLYQDKDLADAIDLLMSHGNTAPFMATRLIQHLVKSNPTPGYVARVAAKFQDNGQGIKGDLKTVVKTILLDEEARAGDGVEVEAGGIVAGADAEGEDVAKLGALIAELEDVFGRIGVRAAVDGGGGLDPECEAAGAARALLPFAAAVFLERGDRDDEEESGGEAADDDQRAGRAAGTVEGGKAGGGEVVRRAVP